MSGIVLALLLAVTPTPSEDPARVAEGRWGGTGISVEVAASGARIELDCAHGTIDAPLALDENGAFDLPGTLVRERPGPVRVDGEEEKGRPVRYQGRLEGDALELRIVWPDARRAPNPLTARKGQAPRLRGGDQAFDEAGLAAARRSDDGNHPHGGVSRRSRRHAATI